MKPLQEQNVRAPITSSLDPNNRRLGFVKNKTKKQQLSNALFNSKFNLPLQTGLFCIASQIFC